MILSGGKSVQSEIHKHISSAWNMEELYELWVKSLLYLFLRCGQSDCSNYQGISLLPVIYTFHAELFSEH